MEKNGIVEKKVKNKIGLSYFQTLLQAMLH